MAKGKHNSGRIDFLGRVDYNGHKTPKREKIVRNFFRWRKDEQNTFEENCIQNFATAMRDSNKSYVLELLETNPLLKKFSDLIDIIPTDDGDDVWVQHYWSYGDYYIHHTFNSHTAMLRFKRFKAAVLEFTEEQILYFVLEAHDVYKVIEEYKGRLNTWKR